MVFSIISASDENNDENRTQLCCPNCGCTELYYETGMKFGRLYHCKQCGYIGTFVIEANQKMREMMLDGQTEKISDNPFTAKEYIPLKRKILVFSILVSAISYAVIYLFPEYSTNSGLVILFIFLLLFIFYLFFVLLNMLNRDNP